GSSWPSGPPQGPWSNRGILASSPLVVSQGLARCAAAVASRRRDHDAAADPRPAAGFVHARAEGLHEELVVGMVVAERPPRRVVLAFLVVHGPGGAVAVRVEGAPDQQAVARPALWISFGPRRAEPPPVRVPDELAVVGVGADDRSGVEDEPRGSHDEDLHV